MGFSLRLVDLIMLRVFTIHYYFLLNGSLFGSLRPKHCLCQEDPLSPYLFICCVEGFIQMVNDAVSLRWGRRIVS